MMHAYKKGSPILVFNKKCNMNPLSMFSHEKEACKEAKNLFGFFQQIKTTGNWHASNYIFSGIVGHDQPFLIMLGLV